MVKTQKPQIGDLKNNLFAKFFYPENPNPYADEVELFQRYGFYWPTADDIIKLAKDHPTFTLDDLVVERIGWKKEGCGFKMIQLVFRKGITSPWFIANKKGDEGEIGEDDDGFGATDIVSTTMFKEGSGDRVACVRVRVAEDKYIERLSFLDTVVPEDEDIKKVHENVLCCVNPCRCGKD
jgi:hypothetical protein